MREIAIALTVDELTEKAKHTAIERARPLLPFSFTFSCGVTFECNSINDIPISDVPCTCGNTNHWFVKWYERIAPGAE